MATVYKAQHVELRSMHALKVIQTPDPSAQERALTEARAQAVLRHPNVLQISDLLRAEEGWPVLVLEYIQGENLAELLQRGQLDLDQIDHIAEGVLSGVAAAHAAGLVHRDLKPSNVLLARGEDGAIRPLVADFGIAKVRRSLIGGTPTQTGIMLGTPGYASPEQMVSARDVDHVSDIFSLGALLYCLVTSRLAFPYRDRLELLRAISHGRYTPVTKVRPDAPERMVRAIDLALRPERDRRVRSVKRLLHVWRGERAVGVQPLPLLAPVEVAPEVVATEYARTPDAPAELPSGPLISSSGGRSWFRSVFQSAPPEALERRTPREQRRRRMAVALPLLGLALLGSTVVLSQLRGGDAVEETASDELELPEGSIRVAEAAEDSVGSVGSADEVQEEPEPAPPVQAPVAATKAPPARREAAPKGPSKVVIPASAVVMTPPPPEVNEVPVQAPEPVGVQARPTIIIHQIEEEEDPAPPEGYGQVVLGEGVTGYAKSEGGVRHALPGPLPPGVYDVYVDFGERGATRIGAYTLSAAERLELRCVPEMRSCR
ncbi:MAG: protein kinase [Alphaproteobacteria bacterium]|nr:protein kinase [Alphaproteobacteria bacterium]